jgi:UDP-N-acetylmuramate--alanine ligase
MNEDRVHLVGIGGVGMSAIARILLARGVPVSGSDAKDLPVLAALRALGAEVHVGYDAAHVSGAGTVVVSAAARATNPEVAQATSSGQRLISRADALAELLTGYRAVAVAGTHGKTTTSWMLAVALEDCGADPSYAIGGDLTSSGVNGHHGTGEVFVAEADESDGSFLRYHPEAAIITSVEADHLDHHGSVEAYEQVFRDFVDTVRSFVVLCADDPGAAALAEHAVARGVRVLSYGTSPGADLHMAGLTADSYSATLRGEPLGDVRLQVAGEHMLRNSAAALLTATELGCPAAPAIAGLARYSGVRRRMELKGTAGGVRVYDDYAHHPSEISPNLLAARGMVGDGRLVAVFQPHLYSRTVTFAEEFGAALGLADEVVVMDVYGAREDPIAGVTGALIADHVPLPTEQVLFEPDWFAVAAQVVSRCRPGDLVLTMGAGDVTDLGPLILQLLAESP